MATLIAPANGSPILFTQQGVGTTPGYSALDERRSNSGGLQEGVLNASDFMVVQRGAGANLSVDIGMPAGGFAYVQGDAITGQGLYTIPTHSTTINEALAPADLTNPRIDSIILEIQDNAYDATGGNLARTRVLTGTPNLSASLSSRIGAPSLPGSALLLADVLVNANSTAVDNTMIRDRRKWARGARYHYVRTAGNYTIGAGFADVDTVNLKPRLECSGAPLDIRVTGTTTVAMSIDIADNGTRIGGATNGLIITAAGSSFSLELPYTPSASSHTFALQAKGVGTLDGSDPPLTFVIQERIGQDTANNTTTSG